MIKGYVFYKEGKIPFVIKEYRMELFSDDKLLDDFVKEYNFKTDYILEGEYYRNGIKGQKAKFLVESSMGSTCYLRCFIICMLSSEGDYDTIGFQSPFLDDVFRYKYKYLEMIRSGVNLAVEPKDAYKIPFVMNDLQYDLVFRVGHDNRLGLLEDFDRKGELLIKLHSGDIQECYDTSIVLHRLAMFMTSHANPQFKYVTLYKNGLKAGWFYCPQVSEEALSAYATFFDELDVMKYVPKILNNIALDSGNKITKSIPLGHLSNHDSTFSPQRFVEQIMAFEYLFDKLEHKKAKDSKFPLKEELKYMFDQFPQLLKNTGFTSDDIGDKIKETRRTIAHGYAYYYDFKGDAISQYQIILLDRLIRNMSLLWMGFAKQEIADYPIHIM